MFCLSLSTGDQLIKHIDELIDRIAVTLPQETHQGGIAPRWSCRFEAIHGTFLHRVEQGSLIITIQPRQIHLQDLRRFNRIEFGDKCQHA